ncbi:MAG: pehX 7 [Mucilaginibacter sp.]|nr:pehX 7 [Mucilaginibacter sp.]
MSKPFNQNEARPVLRNIVPQTFWLMIFWILVFQNTYASDYNIKNYGAVPDGKTIGTAFIQKAIDDCSINGGGRVLVPAGIYLTGSIRLKSNVELHLETGATIIGSTQHTDYPAIGGERGLIFGINIENVSITGFGEINGNGKAFFKGDNAPDRPFLVMFKNSRKINVSGITLKNSAFWTFHLSHNDGVIVNGIRIYSHVNYNNDGIDIDSKNVVISNCIIDTDDDALCFKSDSAFLCENVVVSNCRLASNCNFIKMGTASVGGFKNISISNCALSKASESNFRFWNKNVPGVTDSITGIAGIALEIVDGGDMDKINISNITMEGVQTPIFIRLGSRNNPTGSLKNVMISNITAKSYSHIPSIVTAIPGFYIENVVLKNILIDSKGGGTVGDVHIIIPEKEKEYPENRMFGSSIPAYGLFVRHVKNLTIDNLQLNLFAPDARPALYIEDGEEIKINNLRAAVPVNNQPVIWLNQVENLLLSGYSPNQNVPLFLSLQGSHTHNILLSNNNLENIKTVWIKNATVKSDALKIK